MTTTPTQQPRLHDAPAAQGDYHSRVLGRIDAPNPGPTLVAIAAVHGNERAGIHAAQRILADLNQRDPATLRGSFVALIGNLAALNHPDPQTRFIDHDLNRLCTRERFAEPPETSAEHAQMFDLFDHLAREHERNPDTVVFDMHTTSAPSTPIVAFEDALPTRRLAMSLPLPRYLGLEEELRGLVFDAATRRLGVRALLVEGGQHDDPNAIDVHEAALRVLLDTLRIAPIRDHERPRELLRRAALSAEHACFDLRHAEPITSPDFACEPGIVSGSPAKAGRTVIARQAGKPVVAPISGLVFLPNMQRHKRPGDDAFFIVRRVSTGWFNLSARLRTKPWIHTIIRALPGVHPIANHELLVRADLAAVLKRQLFHLFGYRLVRHDDRNGGAGLTRITKALSAFTRAIISPPKHPPRRDDPDYWIVRRRRLDVALDPNQDDA